MLPQMIYGLDKGEARTRSMELLDFLGLGKRARITGRRSFPAANSSASRIARAVANAPRILLADEPTGNLDPHTAEHVFGTLEKLVRASGLAAVIATHNLDLADRMTRRVTIREGKLEELI